MAADRDPCGQRCLRARCASASGLDRPKRLRLKARFTVDSRAEVGVWASGSVYVDSNGNFVNDPENKDGDDTNEDIAYVLGFTSDNIVAGNFAGAGPDGILGTGDDRAAAAGNAVADGFDKLAAYGRVAGAWRWLVDTDNNGVPNLVITDPSAINGLPVAGNFDGNPENGDEVALKAGNTWHFDRNHDFRVDGLVPGNLAGLPIIGDFDGDGVDDLGVWVDDMFTLDLSSELTGTPVAGSYHPRINGVGDRTFGFGFIGVRERPVAADFDGDGIDDIGLWVPDRVGASSERVAEWYVLISAGRSITTRIVPNPQGAGFVVDFTPKPFANDLFGRFGNEFALPVVGNFDPPVAGDNPPQYAFLNYTNPQNRFDVDGNGVLSALDALILINLLNREGNQGLSTITIRFEATATAPFVDPNADYALTPADVLAVINGINAVTAAGEGESWVVSEKVSVAPWLIPSQAALPHFGGDYGDRQTAFGSGVALVQPRSSSGAGGEAESLAASAQMPVAGFVGQGLPVDGEDSVSASVGEHLGKVGLGVVGGFDFEEILETLAGDVASIWQ